MRCKPPRAHAGALATLDQMMRACFGGFTGFHFEAPACGQGAVCARWSGSWSSVEHASAACLAFFGSSLASCSEVDGEFSRTDVAACADVRDALVALNAYLPLAQTLFLEKAMALKTLKQRHFFCLFG